MTVNPVCGAGKGVGPGAVVGIVVAENMDIHKCVLRHSLLYITHFKFHVMGIK